MVDIRAKSSASSMFETGEAGMWRKLHKLQFTMLPTRRAAVFLRALVWEGRVGDLQQIYMPVFEKGFGGWWEGVFAGNCSKV